MDDIKYMLKNADKLSLINLSMLNRAIGCLREQERLVIYYRYLNKATYKRMEIILGMSESTLKRINKSALRSLKIAMFGI